MNIQNYIDIVSLLCYTIINKERKAAACKCRKVKIMSNTVKIDKTTYSNYGGVIFKNIPAKDRKKLDKIFNVDTTKTYETVEEFITNHNVKTEERISKKGTLMIKVYYPNGNVREYQKSMINQRLAEIMISEYQKYNI